MNVVQLCFQEQSEEWMKNYLSIWKKKTHTHTEKSTFYLILNLLVLINPFVCFTKFKKLS